jgi:hypothetical protein
MDEGAEGGGNGKTSFAGLAYYPELIKPAQEVVGAFQVATRTANSPGHADTSIVEIVARELATIDQLRNAGIRYGAHAQKTYPDPTKRMGAARFFDPDKGDWRHWVNGNPIETDKPARKEDAEEYNAAEFKRLGI